MIIVANSPLNIEDISSEFSADSIENQILETMNSSNERYSYTNLNQLKFELGLRKNIVRSAVALSESGFNFAGFADSKVNPTYWNRDSIGGFRLKSGVTPSDAINDIYTNGNKYATECATAIMIIYYKALIDSYGEEIFNQVFNKIYLMDWNGEEPLLRDATTPKPVGDILLGDRVYFNNPDFNPQTPEWRGENAIVLPDSLYYGHGIGVHNADTIIAELNRQRKPNATQSAYLPKSAGRPDFKKLEKVYQNPPTMTRLVWSSFPTPIAEV